MNKTTLDLLLEDECKTFGDFLDAVENKEEHETIMVLKSKWQEATDRIPEEVRLQRTIDLLEKESMADSTSIVKKLKDRVSQLNGDIQ